MTEVLVAALYKFVALDALEDRQAHLHELCESLGMRGTLLLAPEGINGTIAGAPTCVHQFLTHLRAEPEFSDLAHKESTAPEQPFTRLKVKIKREIVTMGVPDLDIDVRGQYVEPDEWNALISDPDVVVIDTRNDYEVAIGQFSGAINPQTTNFRELPDWIENNPELTADTRVAMYCTGGIRCEKSTAYLRSKGINEVYHLHGGILKYLEVVPEKDSLWSGECFVFDDRISVDHRLEPGVHELCYGCRRPVHPDDKQSDKYVEGISCPTCHDGLTESQKERFAMRQSQHDRAAGKL